MNVIRPTGEMRELLPKVQKVFYLRFILKVLIQSLDGKQYYHKYNKDYNSILFQYSVKIISEVSCVKTEMH